MVLAKLRSNMFCFVEQLICQGLSPEEEQKIFEEEEEEEEEEAEEEEEEEEEEEAVDPKPALVEQCAKTVCAHQVKLVDDCAKRIEGKSGKDCSPWYFEAKTCLDHCVCRICCCFLFVWSQL